MPRTPEVKTNDAIITLAIAGASVEELARDFKLSKKAVSQRIRKYPDIVDEKMRELHPIKYERIVKDLAANKHPNRIATSHNVTPPIIYAMRDYHL